MISAHYGDEESLYFLVMASGIHQRHIMRCKDDEKIKLTFGLAGTQRRETVERVLLKGG